MFFISDYYQHSFALFTGIVGLALPSFEFDPLVLLTLTPYYEFLDMWDASLTLPGEFLETSRTMTSASFGFALLKLVVSAGSQGVFTVLQFAPDNWELVGGENVPLGLGAQSADMHQLARAAKAGDLEALTELVELGGDVNAEDEVGSAKRGTELVPLFPSAL